MTGHQVEFVGGRLTGAVVPKSSFSEKSWYLPSAIVTFINHIRFTAQYTDYELPPEILGIYSADYYLAQVNNGGHSQYVGNSGKSLAANIAAALPGLKMIGADEQHVTLTDLKAWVAANPEETAAQNGFSDRAGPLETLDTRFYAAEKRASITNLAALWIKNWPKLEIVDDERYGDRLRALAALNQNFDIRGIWQAIENNRFNLTDTLQITVAVACGAVKPKPDVKIRINAGSHIEFEGQSEIQWGVTTDKGLRYAIVHGNGGTLCETVPDQNPKSRARTAGRQIANVSAQLVRKFIDTAKRSNADAAIDLIMRRAGYPTDEVGHPALTAWRLEDNRATFIAHIAPRNLIIRTAADGAALLDTTGASTLTITQNEIAAHQAQARRGGESLRPQS